MSDQQKNRPGLVNAVDTVEQSSDIYATVDLVEFAFRLLSNWKLIVCLSLALAVMAGAYSMFFVTPMYEATSTIYVLNRSDSAINLSDLQLGTYLTQDYIKVFDMWEVHEQVITNLDLPYSYKQISRMLTIENTPNTRMLDLTVSSPNPQEAAAAANEYAKVASQFIAETMATEKPSIMSVALVPVNPVSPNKTLYVALGLMLGFAISCGYTFVMMMADDKYKTAEEIRKYTGLTTLAVVPVEQKDEKRNRRRY